MKRSSRREGYGSETKGRATGEVRSVVTSTSYEQSGTFVYLCFSPSFIHSSLAETVCCRVRALWLRGAGPPPL